jgi:Flp pilus assembly pilin Flp
MKIRFVMIRRLRRLIRNERGGTLAELALTLPFLVVMLAGVAEFGRLFQTYTTLDKATRSAARYLSNHKFTPAEQDRAKNLVVCGKLDCTSSPALVPGMTSAKVCIESAGSPQMETVTVRIPRTAGDCGAPYTYTPIFDLGALLNNDTFTLALPLSPSTTMYFIPGD